MTSFTRLTSSKLAAGALLALSGCARVEHRPLELPTLVLWAWQRPEDLRFIDPKTTGVAFLRGTVSVDNNGIPKFQARQLSLELPHGTETLPVVRIETARVHHPIETEFLVAELAMAAGERGLQIDFDARRSSERSTYRKLIEELDQRLQKPISVTALASWCAGDAWLDREPVAEAIPMFFRMGPGENHEMHITSPVCQGSIGLSTDEAWPTHRPKGLQRVYLFSPRAWTKEVYGAALARLKDWK